MKWSQFLREEIEATYEITWKLMERVNPASLEWRPANGANWMTMGQLLRHIGEGCGAGFHAFATGDWGLPDGVKIEDLSVEEMLPPAERLPALEDVEAAKKLLWKDRALAMETLSSLTEEDLENRKLAAPWAPEILLPLGRHLYQMVQHLDRHKGQLFYYLKLMGQDVRTKDLWG